MRRVVVDEDEPLALRLLLYERLERPDRVVAPGQVVAVVVVGLAVLAVVTLLDAVLVHERHEQAVGVRAQPLGLGRAGHQLLEDAFDDRAR